MGEKITVKNSIFNFDDEYVQKIKNDAMNKVSNTQQKDVETFDFSKLITNAATEVEEKIKTATGIDEFNYDFYKELKTKYGDIESAKYTATDYNDIIDTSNDTEGLFKTTLGVNGERIQYKERRQYSNGEIVYVDGKGTIVKRVDIYGTVTLNGQKLYKNGTVTNSLGQIMMQDGSYYSRNSDGSGTRTFKDGSTAKYDKDGNILSIESNGRTIKYNGDEVEVSRSTEKGYEQTTYNKDGSYKIKQYEPNDGSKYTTTYYDQNGNKTSTEKTYKETNAQGGDTVVTESGNKKTYYSGDGKKALYTEETKDGKTIITKYDDDGNPSTVEVTNKDGSTSTSYNGIKHKETNAAGDTTVYNDDGSKSYTEKADGGYIKYYDNGQIDYESKPDGTTVGYDENGNVNYRADSDGTRHYYENGTEIEWVDKDGTPYYINEDGSVYTY